MRIVVTILIMLSVAACAGWQPGPAGEATGSAVNPITGSRPGTGGA